MFKINIPKSFLKYLSCKLVLFGELGTCGKFQYGCVSTIFQILCSDYRMDAAPTNEVTVAAIHINTI